MPLDNFKNNAKVTVSLGYDAAATQIVLQAGDGTKVPTVPCNGEWWNSTDFADPTDDPNKEIVRLTTQTATDTFTIVRAQEGNSAQTHNTAGKVYKMVIGLTAKTLNTDIPATYTAYNATMTTTGGVAFVSAAGTITEDDGQFHWDDTNHRLGIGVNTPSYPLHVKAAGISGYQQITIESTGNLAGLHFVKPPGGTNWSIVATGTLAGQGGGKLIFYRDDIDGNSGSVTLDSLGNMGIGTVSPATALHVVDNAGAGGITFDGTSNPGITLKQNGSNSGRIGVASAAGGWCTDAAAGDVIVRTPNNLIDTVDNGSSIRRMVRPFKSLTNNTATTVFSLTVANNTSVMAKIDYAVEVFDGTNVQCEVGFYYFAVTNKAGTVTSLLAKSTGQSNVTSGTLTVSFTISSANPAVIQVNANSSLTPSAGYPKVTMTIENYTRQAIGPA